MESRIFSGRALIEFLMGISAFAASFAAPLLAQTTAAKRTPSESSSAIQPFLEDQLETVWSEYSIQPSATAPDGEWLRRLFLDLIGRIPTRVETVSFLQGRDRDKRELIVDGLLFGDDYAAEFTRHWTDYWANLLVGRSGGSENNSLTNREGLETFLRNAVGNNQPYDKFVHELITATGTNAPGTEDFNGAVNFLTMKLDDKATLATARTAQLFLGRQVQCTQCHNHPFNEWKQSQFWELNSFFRQAVALRRFQSGSRQIRAVELTDQDFPGEGSTPNEAEIYYEQRNGILKAVYPAFVDGLVLENSSGYLDDVNRRVELAGWVVDSPMLAESFVNRMWGYFLGFGFTSPVDDMGPHSPPSHPELLKTIARTFEDQSYDVRALMRLIVLSRPYSLSSRVNKTNADDDPSLGEAPKFSRFYMRQMTPEQLYESMLVLASGEPSTQNIDQVSAKKRRWLRQFTRALGNDEGGESSSFNGTIPQTLLMFNGRLIREATRFGKAKMLTSIVESETRYNEKVEQLFLACLSRRPTGKEVKMAKQLAIARMQDEGTEEKAAAEGLVDLLWVLANSNEFILNH